MKVLISGAGIAGTVLGYWLHKDGHEVTIVERAPDMRTSGQAIEIASTAAKEIAEKMGFMERLKAMGTTEQGLRFVDDHGRSMADFGVDRKHGRSFTSENEILRSDLAQILYDITKDLCTFQFDDCVQELEGNNNTVTVTFEKGSRAQFDLLVICDGLYSKTRQLAGFDAEIMKIGQTIAYFTIENQVIDMKDKWAKWYNAEGGRVLLSRPDASGKNTRAYLTTTSKTLPDYRKLSQSEQKNLFRTEFKDCGYVIPEVVEGMMTCKDFYMSELAQIKCKNWSRGRVVLCGDACYCPSPISGMGADCAIIGAYVLAGEIRAKSLDKALPSYQKLMTPFIDDAQALPPGGATLLLPQSKRGIKTLHWIAWALSFLVPVLQALPSLPLFTRESFRLPEYGW